MIVATAGHIDHGKTSLVRAITGVNTDRLPEEKARGISIDLGFAYWPQGDGPVIGFVDVPGHERFVRNMLAGVCGIDFAMVVVAADDGVMPQTVEHVRILDLLGVGHGMAVISKVDRVDPVRVAATREEVAALLSTTGLANVPVLEASATSGEGLEAVKAALAAAARTLRSRPRTGRHFRLAIDRAFTLGGSGTVVTGTVVDGAVKPGDRLRLSPVGASVRVRGLQVGGGQVDEAGAGERCAINITGVATSEVARGDWLVHEAIHAPTTRLQVELSVLPDRESGIAHGARVHLHLGAGECLARVMIAGGGTLAPGAAGIAQLVVDTAVVALHGDRFVVRDASARHTVGGGRVLDPFARPPRRGADEGARIEALRSPTAESALEQAPRSQPRRRGPRVVRDELQRDRRARRRHVPHARSGSVRRRATRCSSPGSARPSWAMPSSRASPPFTPSSRSPPA